MSITVAVNATDNANGPRAVCQSVQQNNCAEYNGNDDMAVFDHEKDHQEQLEECCKNNLNSKDKNYCYDEVYDNYTSNDSNQTQLNEENENQKWGEKWNFLMSYIRKVYRMVMDGEEVECYPHPYELKEIAYESKTCDNSNVFHYIDNLIMEFVLVARARQLHILGNKHKDSSGMPQVFVFCLLDNYKKLMVAADLLEDIVKPLEEYHLSKYHFTWKTLNQYLYHSRLYADKTIYDLITTFIEQILSTPVLSVMTSSLIHDYTKFVNEVKINVSEWADANTCIHNIKPTADEWIMSKEIYKDTILNENNLYPPPPISKDELIKYSIPTPPQSPAPEYQEQIEADECVVIDDGDYCDCVHNHSKENGMRISSEDIDQYDYNQKCLNVSETIEISSTKFSYSIIKEKMMCSYSGDHQFVDEDDKPILLGHLSKHLEKAVLNSSTTAQLITKPNVNIKCQSSMDRHVTCKVELEQLPKRRYPYPHVNKPTEPPSKPNSRQHGHSCQKHTEHIKRIHNEGISECSSGRSSQDDSCSERSTSSPRQCDCCYCEVFGHGVPSMAPVSKNYQEMRDRLRNLYLLKKAKQNVHSTNDTVKQKQKESNMPRPSTHQANLHSQTNDKSDAIKGVQNKTKVEANGKIISSKNVPLDKPIDELVNFIEGNKIINEKRAAKKARRREKKEELERIKKEEEEAERKRIEEEERKKQEIERLKHEEALKKERKKGKNQNKQKQNNQQKQTNNSKPQQITKQLQQNTQSTKKRNKQLQGNNKETILTKKDEKCKKDNVEGAKMVTIKRDSDSSKVTITFRGAVEDDVLCTLYDNEAIKAIQRLCDKNKKSQDQAEEKPIKKRRNRKKKQTEQVETQIDSKPIESVLITNKNAPKLPTNMKWYCSPDVNITPIPSSTNLIKSQAQPNTVLIKRTNNNQVFTRPIPPAPQPLPLTSPTAIQINEAVNKISSSSAPIDINKLQLPPGITITKLDPSDYKPPRDIQQSTEKPKPSLQFPFAASSVAVTPFNMQQNIQNNVVVVKTDGFNDEGTTEWSGAGSKRNRRRKKINECNSDNTNSENIQPHFSISNKSSRESNNAEGKITAGEIPTNTPRSMSLPVIIQRHGGMVTIRNPLYQRNDDTILTETNVPPVDGGDDDANPSGKRRRRRRRVKGGSKQTDVEESVFEPKDIDLENGEMDDDERELEAFKRFCLQSVPPQRKEKVHLNIKDIVLKKKSTATAAC